MTHLEQYENKKQKALANFMARATAHFDTPVLRKQAKEMFDANYPQPCPIEGSKLSRCPDCGWENTNIQK